MNGKIRLNHNGKPPKAWESYKVIGRTFVWIKRKSKPVHMPLIPLSYIAKKIVRNKHHIETSVDYGF